MKTALLALVCALIVSTSSASTGTPINNLPKLLSIQTDYIISNVFTPNTNCSSGALDSPCLPKLNAVVKDKVVATYAYLPDVVLPSCEGAFVQLRLCYSNSSAKGRAWRGPKPKNNPTVQDDGKCKRSPKAVKHIPLPPDATTPINATWAIILDVPHATWFVRAYVMCPNQPDNSTSTAIGIGQSLTSSGYFQTEEWNQRPTWLKIVSSVMICTGPVLLAMFFVWDKVLKKKSS